MHQSCSPTKKNDCHLSGNISTGFHGSPIRIYFKCHPTANEWCAHKRMPKWGQIATCGDGKVTKSTKLKTENLLWYILLWIEKSHPKVHFYTKGLKRGQIPKLRDGQEALSTKFEAENPFWCLMFDFKKNPKHPRLWDPKTLNWRRLRRWTMVQNGIHDIEKTH